MREGPGLLARCRIIASHYVSFLYYISDGVQKAKDNGKTRDTQYIQDRQCPAIASSPNLLPLNRCFIHSPTYNLDPALGGSRATSWYGRPRNS